MRFAGDLFLSNSCGVCHKLYKELVAAGLRDCVRIRRLDAEADADAAFARIGARGTPVLLTPDGRTIFGLGPIMLEVREPDAPAAGGSFVLFVGDRCPPCDALKQMARAQGVALPPTASVDQDPRAAAAVEAMGARGVPALGRRDAAGRVTLVAVGPAPILAALRQG